MFTDRIKPISVLAGILLILALNLFLMSFAAAMGFWSTDATEIPELSRPFWLMAGLAWVVSVFLGSILTVMAARIREVKGAVLNSLAAWAGAYIVFGGIALSMAESTVEVLFNIRPQGLFWQGFLSDAIALSAAVGGGWLGAVLESFEQEDSLGRVAREKKERVRMWHSGTPVEEV